MSNRTFDAYKAVFNYIEKNIFELKAKLFMTDFEAALRKAINSCYKGVRLHGCWFHFDRAIHKYCKKRPKLRRVLKTNSNAKQIFKELLSLPLLPEGLFDEGYDAVRQKAKNKRVFLQLVPLFRYFDKYWVPQVLVIIILLAEKNRIESSTDGCSDTEKFLLNFLAFESLVFFSFSMVQIKKSFFHL